MTTIEQTVDVRAPLQRVYNQWTQFEEFPQFMEGVESVQQLDDSHLHWRTSIAGVTREFDARVVEQEPDQIIAWQSLDQPHQAGRVTFQPLDTDTTRIGLRMDFEPEGFAEKTGDKLGIVEARVRGDLQRFKQFIEERGTETGAWRGTV
jgi:uncharacterized membrane protein